MQFLNQITSKFLVLTLVCGVAAQTESVFAADFTFKRLKVNKNQTGPRMNISVTPEDEARRLENPDVKESETPETTIEAGLTPKDKKPKDLQDWFWKDVSPDIKNADFNRMDLALAQLLGNKKKSDRLRPGRKNMEKIITKHGKDILLSSIGKSISPAFVLAVISVESAGKIDAESSAGAQGLMQLIPATAERFNVKDVNDPQQNIDGGTAYLSWLLSEFQRDPLLALAGYNAGENAVKKHKGVPPYPETRAYIPKVVAAWDLARTFCQTLPRTVSDPCVFKF